MRIVDAAQKGKLNSFGGVDSDSGAKEHGPQSSGAGDNGSGGAQRSWASVAGSNKSFGKASSCKNRAGTGLGKQPNTGKQPDGGRGKGSGGSGFPAFSPSSLKADQWHGNYVGGSVDALFKIKEGEHLLAGVMDQVPAGILALVLPQDATLSIVLSKSADCSKPVRAQAFDKRGVPKVVSLHTVQLGKVRPILRWQAQEAKPLPEGQQSKVVRVACIKQFVTQNEWGGRAKNFSGAVKTWLASLRIPKDDIVDIFAPRKSECGTILSVNVRVVVTRSAEVEMASGIAGFLSRELPSDSTVILPCGHIKWCRKKDDESGPAMLCRARGEAELSSPCLGLA